MPTLWDRFQRFFLRNQEVGVGLDISRMRFEDGFLDSMRSQAKAAFVAMQKLEAGGIANPDENRMVGHYWLRNPSLAPTPEIRDGIEQTNQRIKDFARDVHEGKIKAAAGNFRHLLVIGIGGSALGPQFIADALGKASDPMTPLFFDNTDPDGFDRVWEKLGDALSETLVVVISKSGGTKETRNGMVESESRFKAAGLDFSKQAVAVTGEGSDLDQHAAKAGWLARFPMHDWVGGRTSIMSTVGYCQWRCSVSTSTLSSLARQRWTNGRGWVWSKKIPRCCSP